MEIIYVHHAQRNRQNPSTQTDDITVLGESDANMVAEVLYSMQNKNKNIKAVYTSEYLRCTKTTNILNKKLNLPTIIEPRLNEFKSMDKNETWLKFQTRIREALHDIVNSYRDDEAVICVTSGLNLVAFTSLAHKLKPDINAPMPKVISCSPIIFDINKNNF